MSALSLPLSLNPSIPLTSLKSDMWCQHRSQSSQLEELWEELESMALEKGVRLQEAVDQQQFLHAIKDVDLWLDEVEKLLSSEELGKVRPVGIHILMKFSLLSPPPLLLLLLLLLFPSSSSLSPSLPPPFFLSSLSQHTRRT